LWGRGKEKDRVLTSGGFRCQSVPDIMTPLPPFYPCQPHLLYYYYYYYYYYFYYYYYYYEYYYYFLNGMIRLSSSNK